MSSREEILQSIRCNTQMRYEKPDYTSLEAEAVTYSNRVEQFCKMVGLVGGKAFPLGNLKIDDVITQKYSPRRVASTMTEVEVDGAMQKINCVTFNPDEVASTAELDGTDVAIVKGVSAYAKTERYGFSRTWSSVRSILWLKPWSFCWITVIW